MSGITSGVGLFSGIDTGSIIEQLLRLDARPRDLAQSRIVQLQLQNTAYLDINTRLSALQSAAKAFRDNKTFQTKSATSSNEDVLTATASTTAPVGSFQFIVDRLVSTQQMLSRGFANRDVSAVGLTEMTLESSVARLDRDVSLADLNGGQGVARGKILITDSGGRSAEVDLSRTTSVQEVLDAINGNGTARVSARVQGGRFVITDTGGGGGTMTIANVTGYTTASSLGIAGSAVSGKVTGSNVYSMTGDTAIASLNDGRGVAIKNTVGEDAYSFMLTIDDAGTPVNLRINIGDVYESIVPDGGGDPVLTRTQGAVTTVQGVIDRINAALDEENIQDIAASVDSSTGRITIVDSTGTRPLSIAENGSTTAADLGILTTSASTTISGKRVFAGMNTTLARGLNGGAGLSGNGQLNFTLRDGTDFNLTIDTQASLSEIFAAIEDASDEGAGKRVSVTLDSDGTGIVVTDLTGGTTSNFTITGTVGQDTAASLGISTGAAGIASATKSSGNLQRAYISNATLLSSLNNGRGIGTGTFRLVDSDNTAVSVTVSDSIKTVGDLVSLINSRGARVTARINSQGDGIEIVEDTSVNPAGGAKIRIEDTSGSTARLLNLAGEADGTGTSNRINGSYERTIEFSAADTLDQIVSKLNEANAGVSAAVVRDGSSTTPFRLSLTSTNGGAAGRFILNTGTFNLGLQTLDTGQDSRIFYGSTDAARAIAVSSSSNTVDSLVPGVRIDLRATSEDPVSLSVASDTEAIEAAVGAFVSTFNTLITRIDSQSAYNEATEKGGPLLGDGTTRELRSSMFALIQSPARNVSGRFSTLADVGVTVGNGGTLELDNDRLREALQEDPAAVEALFTAREQVDDTFIDLDGVRVRNPNAGNEFSSLGVMGLVEQLVDRYIDSSSGVLTARRNGLDDQIKLQNSRITAMNERLERRRTSLQRQFTAMEVAIAKMQTQQSALGSLG